MVSHGISWYQLSPLCTTWYSNWHLNLVSQFGTKASLGKSQHFDSDYDSFMKYILLHKTITSTCRLHVATMNILEYLRLSEISREFNNRNWCISVAYLTDHDGFILASPSDPFVFISIILYFIFHLFHSHKIHRTALFNPCDFSNILLLPQGHSMLPKKQWRQVLGNSQTETISSFRCILDERWWHLCWSIDMTLNEQFIKHPQRNNHGQWEKLDIPLSYGIMMSWHHDMGMMIYIIERQD